MTGDGNSQSRFVRVYELLMTACLTVKNPALLVEAFEDIAKFHDARLSIQCEREQPYSSKTMRAVPSSETAMEPRQPSRLEKKPNIR